MLILVWDLESGASWGVNTRDRFPPPLSPLSLSHTIELREVKLVDEM